MKSVELFVGAGGLAMGVGSAGFEPEVVIEYNDYACETIRQNQARGNPFVKNWNLYQGDVRDFDYGALKGINFVSGGPPCQPFSLGGKHRGQQDNRDMFPEAVRAVRELRPMAFMFENVRGLLRESFSKYFEYITLQLSYPELVCKLAEDWRDHLARLEKHHSSGNHDGLHYRVLFQLLNAADFGVPQRRARVFIVGFRSDFQREWAFPLASHSQEALLYSQWVDGSYWDRHSVSKRKRPACPDRVRERLANLTNNLYLQQTQPWRTIRDAISDLPEPSTDHEVGDILNHRLNPGGKIYAGHTGSPLDEPAKTLKAGDHGVPGGENMIALPDGAVRYFTIRESARLQTFPDDFHFHGSWSECMRQLGNAVPLKLAAATASQIHSALCAN